MRQVVEGWVWGRNVRPLIVEAALSATDDERDDGWYSYPLAGPDRTVRVRLATAVGSDVVCVEISGVQTAELRIRADTLLSAFATT
ncbi:hypothetical protein ACGRHY_26280 [Streptomyces sp. HK10]|uniref:hypothetical protein n=1 Tax=Streptomyces sp. HK10 TaxID=3373255 RepID=UPI00374A08B6